MNGWNTDTEKKSVESAEVETTESKRISVGKEIPASKGILDSGKGHTAKEFPEDKKVSVDKEFPSGGEVNAGREVFADNADSLDEPPSSYKGEGGLLYCTKCHAPLQTIVKILGREKIVSCECRCEREARLKKEKKLEEKERALNISHLRISGIQDKTLRSWRFENAEENHYISQARRYADNWEKVRKENLGLLYWGDIGTGKSFTAACIANALIDRGIPVLMTDFSKILSQIESMYNEDRSRYAASFSNYPLLVIDDLGIERGTDYAKEQIYAIINERYKSGLPLIVTTNLPISKIRHPDNLADARIMSRILEMCTPIQIRGIDRRIRKNREKQETVKKLLEGDEPQKGR